MGAHSEQTFLGRGQYPLVTKVEVCTLPACACACSLSGALPALRLFHVSRQERLARLTMLPWQNGEDMQILRCVRSAVTRLQLSSDACGRECARHLADMGWGRNTMRTTTWASSHR